MITIKKKKSNYNCNYYRIRHISHLKSVNILTSLLTHPTVSVFTRWKKALFLIFQIANQVADKYNKFLVPAADSSNAIHSFQILLIFFFVIPRHKFPPPRMNGAKTQLTKRWSTVSSSHPYNIHSVFPIQPFLLKLFTVNSRFLRINQTKIYTLNDIQGFYNELAYKFLIPLSFIIVCVDLTVKSHFFSP